MPTPAKGYRVADGSKVPGTTTILGRFKESGGLIQWAYQQGKKDVPLYESRDLAGDVGTHIHAMIENAVRSQPLPEFPAGMKEEHQIQATSGYEAFMRWSRRLNLDIAPVEVPLVCECHRFGGTPDAIAAEEDGSLSLLDWKSSKNFYPDQLVQLAAYFHLWNINKPETPIKGNILIVRFGKEGADFEHREFPINHAKMLKAWRLFELYREAYDADRFISGKE
jgi:hypothetical protein